MKIFVGVLGNFVAGIGGDRTVLRCDPLYYALSSPAT